jgi:hypothetical protein
MNPEFAWLALSFVQDRNQPTIRLFVNSVLELSA